MKSWKTTTTGIIGIVGTTCTMLYEFLTTGSVNSSNIANNVTIIIVALGLIFARDNNKTSEQVGAGK